SQVRDAQIFALMRPPIRGLGQASGFTLQLLNSQNLDRATFKARRDELLALARQDPRLTSVRPSALEDQPTLNVTIDEGKALALGLLPGDVYDTLAAAWGSNSLNGFVARGRVKRVFMQGDAAYRAEPADLGAWS